MDFTSFAQSIWTQIVTIWNAPVPFVAVAIALWFAMRAYYRAHYSKQLADSEARLKLRDDEIADYRRKLDGASPDEAKAALEKLQAEVNSLKPRRLTRANVAEMIGTLAGSKGRVHLIADMSCADARPIVEGFAAAFGSVGWTISTGAAAGPVGISRTGIRALIREGATAPASAAGIEALKASGLPFELSQGLIFGRDANDDLEVIVSTPY